MSLGQNQGVGKPAVRQRELCSMPCASWMGGGWGRMDAHTWMAESLLCASETITLLIGYAPIQNGFGVKKIKIKLKKTQGAGRTTLWPEAPGKNLPLRLAASGGPAGLAAASLQPLLSPQAASPVCQTPHHTSLIRTPGTGRRAHLVLTWNIRPPPDSSLQHVGQDETTQSSQGSALAAPVGLPARAGGHRVPEACPCCR